MAYPKLTQTIHAKGTSSRPWNPLYAHPAAVEQSNYLGMARGRLASLLQPDKPCNAEEQAAHDHLKLRLLGPGFPCVAARSAINRQTYRFGLYPTLGSQESALTICHDIYEFSHELGGLGQGQVPFTSFIAMFQKPRALTEIAFERLLWQQLQYIHEIDAGYFGWDTSVSGDPDDAKFSFSIGGRAFFVIGLHPAASRLARVTDEMCMVFNPHEQFEALRANGSYDKLQQAIRQRDMAYQGSINPVLTNFGEASESRQYSGRSVPSQWQCPFHQRSSIKS